MNLSDLLAKLNRLQRWTPFKIAATVLVVLMAIGAIGYYVVEQNSKGADERRVKIEVRTRDPVSGAPIDVNSTDPDTVKKRATARADAEADAQYYNDLLDRQADWAGFAAVVCIFAGVLIGFIWLGLGLVAPLLLGIVLPVAWRLKLFAPQDIGLEELSKLDQSLLFAAGVAILAAAFLVLMELLKLAFGPSRSVTAIARNVVAEAVRLKVSLVLIVLMIFGLAALPGLLDPGTPLRYRVQSFLEYGTGGAFWVIAILVLFLSVGSVTFEQRDRVIWQTMTKPVAAWQYLLGKWLGVSGVAAVLLLVSTSGVFAFTEYLSRQKAMHEIRPYVAEGAIPISDDREILSSQVLAARRNVFPTPPKLTDKEIEAEITRRIELALRQAGSVVSPEVVEEQQTPENRSRIRGELMQELKDKFLAIEAGKAQEYIFYGLGDMRKTSWESIDSAASRLKKTPAEVEALIKDGALLSKDDNGRVLVGRVAVRSLTLRYKVQAGGNDPRTMFYVTFSMAGQAGREVKQVPLNTMMTLHIPNSAIDEDGSLKIRVYNGDENTNTPNESTFVFPSDGFSLYYSAGSYRMNFLRVVIVLWFKLAFLAMVAIVASTFLSFPVASMISFGVFLIAEGATYVWEALNYYDAEVDGKLVFYRLAVRIVSLPIAWTFKHFSELAPIQNLTDGVLLSWPALVRAAVMIGVVCAFLYSIGVIIFRRRELATYSGQ